MTNALFKEQVEIEYSEAIVEIVPCEPPASGHYGKTVGDRRVKCLVEVEFDVGGAARSLGRKAISNKSGKSIDGFVTVRRLGAVKELSRKLRPIKE